MCLKTEWKRNKVVLAVERSILDEDFSNYRALQVSLYNWYKVF